LQGVTPSANPLLADTNVTDAGSNAAGTGCRCPAELACDAAGVGVVGVVGVVDAEADADDAAVVDATADGEPLATAEVRASLGCW